MLSLYWRRCCKLLHLKRSSWAMLNTFMDFAETPLTGGGSNIGFWGGPSMEEDNGIRHGIPSGSADSKTVQCHCKNRVLQNSLLTNHRKLFNSAYNSISCAMHRSMINIDNVNVHISIFLCCNELLVPIGTNLLLGPVPPYPISQDNH